MKNKLNSRDKELLDWYIKGFKDELNGSSTAIKAVTDEDKLNIKAYQLGANHAILGEDIRKVDYLSDDEILIMIKHENKTN